MANHPGIERFVRDILGCSCPDEVFRDIGRAALTDAPWYLQIRVGGRLLIYLADADRADSLPALVAAALHHGVAERDRDGFNRFRLVLCGAAPEGLRAVAEQAFADAPERDERTHLHLVEAACVAGL